MDLAGGRIPLYEFFFRCGKSIIHVTQRPAEKKIPHRASCYIIFHGKSSRMDVDVGKAIIFRAAYDRHCFCRLSIAVSVCKRKIGRAMISIEKTQVIALVHGLHPHAEALDCEDVKGPRSLFGESVPVPKPVSSGEERDSWAKKKGGPQDIRANARVLWENSEALSPEERARRVLSPEAAVFQPAAKGSPPRLDVPASTYIAGRCTSSFNLAWHLLENGMLPEWGAVLCSCQTEGRGQLRRTWHSPRGNLYVSFRLPHDANLQGDAASLVTGGLLAGAFKALGFPLSLKWPNDLLLAETSKVGGLLLEERDGVILAGLGLNLAECPPAALLRADRATPAAVLLPCHARESGAEEPLAPFALWRHLVSAAILEYTCSVAGRSLSRVLDGFERLLAWKGKRVILTEADGSSFSGRYQGLGGKGGLLLQHDDGSENEFCSGSLSLAAVTPGWPSDAPVHG